MRCTKETFVTSDRPPREACFDQGDVKVLISFHLWQNLQSKVGGGIGEFRGIVERLHCRVSELIHCVVIHRGEAG